jgi:hypothetical protein
MSEAYNKSVFCRDFSRFVKKYHQTPVLNLICTCLKFAPHKHAASLFLDTGVVVVRQHGHSTQKMDELRKKY